LWIRSHDFKTALAPAAEEKFELLKGISPTVGELQVATPPTKMSSVDYLLHESSVGYAIFHVESQPETIGNRLKEVQDASQDLAKFGKLIKLVNFAPYR